MFTPRLSGDKIGALHLANDFAGDVTFSRSTALRPEWLATYPGIPDEEHQTLPEGERLPANDEDLPAFGEEEAIPLNDTFSLGVLALNAGNFEDAVQCFNSVLEESPDDEEAYLHRGEAYLGLGDYDNAFEDACTCVELDPDDVDGVFLRGRALFHLGALDDATAELEYLIRLEGRGAEGWWRKWRYHYWRGRLFVAEGEFQKALRAFNRAVNFAPMQVEPFIHRSRLYEQIGREEEARADQQMAFQLNPEIAEREFGPQNS